MAYKIKAVKEVQNKSKTHEVEYLGYRDVYRVKSSTSDRFYVVQANIGKCTCDRQRYISKVNNGGVNACSHTQAVTAFINKDYQLVARKADEDISHLHRKTFNELAADGVVLTGRKI